MAMAPVVSYAPRQLSGDCPRNAVRLGKNCLRAGFTPGMLRSCESASKPFADLLHRCIPGRSPSISLRGARRLGGRSMSVVAIKPARDRQRCRGPKFVRPTKPSPVRPVVIGGSEADVGQIAGAGVGRRSAAAGFSRVDQETF